MNKKIMKMKIYQMNINSMCKNNFITTRFLKQDTKYRTIAISSVSGNGYSSDDGGGCGGRKPLCGVVYIRER